MKKSKSLEITLSDFQEVFDTTFSFSLYEYVTSSLFNNPLHELNSEENKIYSHLKKFENKNALFNYLTVNLISIVETYLQNVLIEIIEKDEQKSIEFINQYRFEKAVTTQNVIDGPKKLVLDVLNDVIYHRLSKVNTLFKIIGDIDILSINGIDCEKIFQIIRIRHKLVHQSGRVRGKKLYISELTFLGFMTLFSNWILNIDSIIFNREPRKRTTDYRTKFYKQMSKSIENPVFLNGMNEILSTGMLKMDKIFDGNKGNEINL